MLYRIVYIILQSVGGGMYVRRCVVLSLRLLRDGRDRFVNGLVECVVDVK